MIEGVITFGMPWFNFSRDICGKENAQYVLEIKSFNNK